MNIKQKNISAVVEVLVSILLLIMGFSQGDQEAYLFPRILAIVISVLAIMDIFSLFSRKPNLNTGSNMDIYPWRTIFPGLGVLILSLLLLEILGFYATSLLVFFLMAAVYRKNDEMSLKNWLFDLGIASLFTASIYLLFAVTLRVQTPQGWLI